MVPIIAHIIFAYVGLRWLSWEFDKPFTPKKHIGWMAANTCFGIIALALSGVDNGRLGNILLHSIGGGMATACTFQYFKRNLNLKFNWRVDFVALFFLVSTFGVMNEIFEYAADIAGWGVYSIDRFDTWKDFYSNTAGAVIVWTFVRLFLQKTKKKN